MIIMDTIKLDERDIQVAHIESVETRVASTRERISQVKIRTASGELYTAFEGTPTACADFRVAFHTAIKGTNLPIPTVDWVYFKPVYPVVELGKVVHLETMWNGKEFESAGFTYSVTDMNTAEVVLAEVLGVAEGQTEFKVAKDGKNEKGIVTVVPSKDGIVFEHLTTGLPVGGSVLVPLRKDGVAIPWQDIHFLSSNPAVATVTERGQVDVIGTGSTLIIAQYKGQKYGHYVEGMASAKTVLKATTEPTATPKKTPRAKKPTATVVE